MDTKSSEYLSKKRFNGRKFALYTVDEIEHFMQENPTILDSKQGKELRVGCILAKCDEQNINDLPLVGYLMKGSYSRDAQIPRPTMSSIIGNKAIDDRDFDIFLQNKDHHGIVQITELEKHGAKDDANKGLQKLIAKKLKVQSDNFLQLVVCVNHTFELNMKSLQEFFEAKQIPFKRIYLVGRFGENPEPGAYRCMEIFPETYISDIRLNI